MLAVVQLKETTWLQKMYTVVLHHPLVSVGVCVVWSGSLCTLRGMAVHTRFAVFPGVGRAGENDKEHDFLLAKNVKGT